MLAASIMRTTARGAPAGAIAWPFASIFAFFGGGGGGTNWVPPVSGDPRQASVGSPPVWAKAAVGRRTRRQARTQACYVG